MNKLAEYDRTFSEINQDDYYLLADILKHNRKRIGLSQKQVSKMIGVSQQLLSLWENGKVIIPYPRLLMLIDLYYLTINEIWSSFQLQKRLNDETNL